MAFTLATARAHLVAGTGGPLDELRIAPVIDLGQLSTRTGATLRDSMVDVDGGFSVLFVYGSKDARELPDGLMLPDGDVEIIGKQGTFGVGHVHTSLRGVAVQINAFNFPFWGMLERLPRRCWPACHRS